MAPKTAPIGLRPLWIGEVAFLTNRLHDINQAVQRYREAGHPVPEQWHTEHAVLSARIAVLRQINQAPMVKGRG